MEVDLPRCNDEDKPNGAVLTLHSSEREGFQNSRRSSRIYSIRACCQEIQQQHEGRRANQLSHLWQDFQVHSQQSPPPTEKGIIPKWDSGAASVSCSQENTHLGCYKIGCSGCCLWIRVKARLEILTEGVQREVHAQEQDTNY